MKSSKTTASGPRGSLNMIKKPTSQRVDRELSATERERLKNARREAASKKGEILAEGRLRKQAREAMQRELQSTIAALRSRRELLGLSLADVEARSGLKRSALSRLENSEDPNPTLLTLHRYAAAVGVSLSTVVNELAN